MDLTLSDMPKGNPEYVKSCQKSEKEWKIYRVFMKTLPMGGPEGNQTVLSGADPKDFFFKDNLWIFYCLYQTLGLQTKVWI